MPKLLEEMHPGKSQDQRAGERPAPHHGRYRASARNVLRHGAPVLAERALRVPQSGGGSGPARQTCAEDPCLSADRGVNASSLRCARSRGESRPALATGVVLVLGAPTTFTVRNRRNGYAREALTSSGAPAARRSFEALTQGAEARGADSPRWISKGALLRNRPQTRANAAAWEVDGTDDGKNITRPALSKERVQCNTAGHVVLKLKTPWRDGTTHLGMSPPKFTQRPAALVPRPRLHLIRFHGVLAPNARLRAMVMPKGRGPPAQAAPCRVRREVCASPADAADLGEAAQARL